jgi:group I intron endonuclease
MQSVRVEMKGVIYCYYCIPTGKKYIGQTVKEKHRKRQHINHYKTGVDNKFYRAVRKYGWDNFIYGIIDYYDAELLNEQEVFYIGEYDTYHNGYNSTLGGEGMRGFTHNEETRKKLSKAHKGRVPTEEQRRKIGEASKGRKHSEKTRKKISDGISGKNHPMYGKVGKLHHGYGIPRSDETKQKISNTLKGRPLPKDVCEKIQKIMEEKYSHICYEITKPDGSIDYIHNSLKAYSIENALKPGQMYNVANGKANHHKGYKVKKYLKTLQDFTET